MEAAVVASCQLLLFTANVSVTIHIQSVKKNVAFRFAAPQRVLHRPASFQT